MAWGGDNRTVFYIEKDPVTLLGLRVRKHVLGTDPALGPARLRGTGRGVLHVRRDHQGSPLHPDPFEQHDHFRSAFRARGRSGVPRSSVLLPRAARPRVFGRPHRRPLDHPHELAGAQFPDHGRCQRSAARASTNGARSSPHDEAMLHRGFRVVQPVPRGRGALGRPAQDPHPAVGRRARVPHRFRRAGVSDVARRQRGNRQRRRALSLHVAHHAAHHLRLRRAHR